MSAGSVDCSLRESTTSGRNVPPTRDFPRHTSCCCIKPNSKIYPDITSSLLVEIREKRWLQIYHYHPTVRDEQFHIEYETYLKYRKTGRDFTRKQQLLQLLLVKQRSRSNSIVSNSSLLNSAVAVRKKKITTDSMKTEWSGSGALPGSVVGLESNVSGKNAKVTSVVSPLSSGDNTHVENQQSVAIKQTINNLHIKTGNISVEIDETDKDNFTGSTTLKAPVLSSDYPSSLDIQHSDNESIKTSRDVQLSMARSQPRINQHIHDRDQDSIDYNGRRTNRESLGAGDNCNRLPHNVQHNSKLSTSTFRDSLNHNERPTSNDSQESDGSNISLEVDKEPHYQDKEAKNQVRNNNQDKGSIDQDKENSAVLFFFHGVGGSADVWQPQVDYFQREGYEIVVADLLGHGFSQAPRTRSAYHFKELTKDIVAIFDKYCKRRNVVIGHSYGSCFATVLARQRSLYVTKLILISGGGPTPLEPQPGIFSLPTCLLGCLKPILVCGFKRSAFVTKSKTYVPKEKAFDVPSYVLKHTMNGQDWKDGNESFHRWISVPTLLIYGINDPLVTLWETEAMQKTVFGSTLEVVNDASHMVMIDQPEVTNKLIHNFLHKDFRVIGAAKHHKTFNQRQSSTVSLKTLPPSGIFMTPRHKDH